MITSPHFHAQYGEHEALIAIADLGIFAGGLPPRALGLVMEWASMHRMELQSAWDRASAMEPIGKIEPLS
jgi:hypothetical protein